MKPISIPAVWMRGGTSKGLFFHHSDLPEDPIQRDRILLAAMGSPDPYGKQIDGLGGASSSTSKIALIKASEQTDLDLEYSFGQVAIDQPLIDYSGNCGNLSAAVGVFAIEQGLVQADPNGITRVGVWQTNLAQKMIIHVPTSTQGEVHYQADYKIAGVIQLGSAIQVEFIRPGDANAGVLTTGQAQQILTLEDGERIAVSLISAGNATVFVTAGSLGLKGDELPDQINSNTSLLVKIETIRCAAAVAMGLADSTRQAQLQPATPKLAFVAKPMDYSASDTSLIKAEQYDLCARIFSMGKLHHAFTGTGAIALAVAAAIPGTLLTNLLSASKNTETRIGHSSGLMTVSARVESVNGRWIAHNATLYRTARTLMRGELLIPQHYL